MRTEQCFALALLVMNYSLREAYGEPSNQGMVNLTKQFAEVFKSSLSEDTYAIVEDPSLNGSAKIAFVQAHWAAWRVKVFFTIIRTTEYPGLVNQRRSLLDSIADFLNSSETALKELPGPFGRKQCQLVPEELLQENIKSLEDHIVRECKNATAEPQSTAKTAKCLQALVARNTNYSKEAMEMFKRSLGKHVFTMIHLKGFCWPFTEATTAMGLIDEGNATERFISKLRAGMELLDELPLKNTGPWTCKDTPQLTTASPTSQLTTAVNDSVVRGVAQRVANEFESDLNGKGWSGRDGLHKQIVRKTVDQLKNISNDHVFNAVVFLPFDRNDQKCIYKEADFIDAGYRNLNFFVHYAAKGEESDMGTATQAIAGQENAILNHVFAKANGDLCNRLKSAMGGNADKFDGIVAVKCGYKFVWYQLGYEYFHAAASSAKDEAALETRSGGYDAKCGQIFFFP